VTSTSSQPSVARLGETRGEPSQVAGLDDVAACPGGAEGAAVSAGGYELRAGPAALVIRDDARPLPVDSLEPVISAPGHAVVVLRIIDQPGRDLRAFRLTN
jgi:hypothetical protein